MHAKFRFLFEYVSKIMKHIRMEIQKIQLKILVLNKSYTFEGFYEKNVFHIYPGKNKHSPYFEIFHLILNYKSEQN